MGNMLSSHMNAIENLLIAQSKIAANTGHPLHKGTPREVFIKDFLANHLPDTLAIGSGEIISYDSLPNEPRNQFDIILYKKNFPKLTIGGGVNCFLVESVVATIEVKSTLDEKGLEQAMKAARNVKNMKRSLEKAITSGAIPPSVINLVVAFDGPADIRTVYGWKNNISTRNNIPHVTLPDNILERRKTPSSSIDNVFILGKGMLGFDNSLIELIGMRRTGLSWWLINTDRNVLVYFFFILTMSCNNLDISFLKPEPYFTTDDTYQMTMGI